MFGERGKNCERGYESAKMIAKLKRLYRKLFSFRYNCRGYGGLQAIPQGVTAEKCDKKEHFVAPEGH